MHALFQALLVVMGLAASEAQAATGPAPLFALATAPARAADLPKLPKNDKAEKAISASEAEAERKRKGAQARVIVLKWPDNRSVDYTDGTIQRMVRSRIARPEAAFFPEVDLYQNGRKLKAKGLHPSEQPARVPDKNLTEIREAIAAVERIPWNGMQPDAWGLKAQELRALVEKAWFVEKVEQREPLFLLYAQIGRAAENQNAYVPPFYEQIGNAAVNYYWYLAATMAAQDPSLLSKITDQELNASIGALLAQLQAGNFPNLKIDFEQEGEDFNTAAFGEKYELYLNGMKTDLPEEGQLDIFLGRTDIYLKRADSGSGLSERLEVSKLEDKIYFVRDTARKKMGADFISQLFLNPNECTPALDGEILTYLAIYAKLHEKADIYIAVPQYGNPNRTYVWRYDRTSSNLSLVGGGADAFPVRFVASAGVGVLYNDAVPVYDVDPDRPPSAQSTDPLGDLVSNNFDADVKLTPLAVPLDLQMRLHYDRLVAGFGFEVAFNTGGSSGDAQWVERYPTPGHDEATILAADVNDTDDDGDKDEKVPAYYETAVARSSYLSLGYAFGQDANIGFGPRTMLRLAFSNVPRAFQPSAHVGWTMPPPLVKSRVSDRVRPFVDIEGRFGLVLPFEGSLAWTEDFTFRPVFGLTGAVGTTF